MEANSMDGLKGGIIMKKSIYLLMALAAIVSVACDKDNEIRGEETPDTEEPVITSTHELKVVSNVTKLALLDSGTDAAITFEESNNITVFNGVVDETNHHGLALYKCTSVIGGMATFTLVTDNSSYCSTVDTGVDPVAIFPNRGSSTAGWETYGAGTVKVRMLASISKADTSDDNDTFSSTSLPLVASASAGEALSFKQTIGMLKLTLTGTERIRSIAVTSDKYIAGDCSVPYASSTPALTVQGEDGNGSISNFNTVTYTYNNNVTLTAAGVPFYIGLPAGTHNLTVVITDSEGRKMTKTAAGLTIQRGVITPSTLAFAEDEVPVTKLSDGAKYANCYVVTASGRYCFDACKPDGTEVTGTSAAWVWADGEACNGATGLPSTMMTGISYGDGKVYFTVPDGFKVGNVVLGLLDDSSNLLYTWHVWLTSNDMGDITTNGITIMDRNLGAGALYDVALEVNAPLQAGKGSFYQWGRKDPFPGGRNSSAGTAAETTPFGTANSQYNVINTTAAINNVSAWAANQDLGGVTAEAGASHPVSMAASSKVPGYIASDTSTPWCSRANANPCPYGYRVMNRSEFAALIAAGVVASNYGNFGQVKLAGSVIFPRAGFREGANGGSRYGQTSARYYCNDVSGTEANKGYAYKFDWSSGNYSSSSEVTYNAYNACSVRCVKE